jgi:hypothetical protein
MRGRFTRWHPCALFLLLSLILVGCGGPAHSISPADPSSDPASPVISWNPPTSIAAGTALSSTQLNATANVPGTFTYNPTAGTVLSAGSHSLATTFTPTNTTSYKTATATVNITVATATPVITWGTPASIMAGTALGATQLDASANVPGSFVYNPAAGAVLSAGTHALAVTFTPNDTTDYAVANASVNITVNQANPVTPVTPANPVITWNAPAAVAAGTALGASQLNATANVPGTFVYNPAAGTVLTAGTHSLAVTFTPTDTTAYTTATATVSITVNKANPVITWAAPASIVSGTALGANQLNATANVPGSFVYNPASGTVLSAGAHALAATFTPNDTTDYTTATATNSITVTSATTAPTGPVVNVDPSMTTQEIQSALNGAPSGATISFAAGTYNITAQITVPCANLQLTGPVSTPPTAILSASYTNDVIFTYNGGCTSLGSIEYLAFENTGAVYIGVGNNSNFTFEYNTVSNLPSNLSNTDSESGLFFDGSLSTTLSNVLVEYNTFGDPNSCSSVFATGTDEGGSCAGVITSQGEDDNVTIEYNTFNHVEEGIHFNQLASWNPGNQDSVCVSCTIDYNYIVNYHRIGIEIQVDTPTNSIMLEHNAVVDPLNSSYGTFAVSLACCQWGTIMGTDGYSPALVFNDNLLIASQPCGGECPPYGVEFWGTGSEGTNSLIEGNFSNGYTWGFGEGSWAINNNYICGPNYPTQGGYISNEEGGSNPPSQSGNTTAAQCQTTTSTAPTISPSGGSFTTSQVVTLSDTGANTGIWYTTDGSKPVPGSGTAKYYTGPFTISSSTVVNAVGMWGAANQPASYPSGYGYVPSAVVTATFTN